MFFYGCSSAKNISGSKSISALKFVDEFDVPNAMQFKNTTVGGLSGIDYDPASKLYYLICDDRSAINPARFYTATISISANGIDTVQLQDVITLKTKNGNTYPNSKQDPFNTPDPEAMRFNALKNELVWSSEGERIMRNDNVVLVNPGVYITDKNGVCKDSFELPSNLYMQRIEKGPRQNGVFEGLSFSGDHKFLYVSVEEPLYEDGPRAGINDSFGIVRIIKFDAETRKEIKQYLYKIEAVAYPPNPPGSFKVNGVPDILWMGDDKLLVVERSFSNGRLACTIRVFLADLNAGTKKLLLNMDDLGRYIDNVEGVTFGPLLPNGHRSLIFVADDNFSAAEKTQFFLFEILP